VGRRWLMVVENRGGGAAPTGGGGMMAVWGCHVPCRRPALWPIWGLGRGHAVDDRLESRRGRRSYRVVGVFL
jgi:hypothetical protein